MILAIVALVYWRTRRSVQGDVIHATTSFARFTAFETPCASSADPDVAAGPDLFGVTIQRPAYFYNKTTGALDHKFFWEAYRGQVLSDVHIVFDRSSQRWFITTIVDLGSSQQGFHQGVQVMVSRDASAKEWMYSTPIDVPQMIDNPEPTVTSDKVVITHDRCVWVIDKAALIAGHAPVVQPRFCDVANNNQVAAVKYGGDPPATAYAITMSDSTHLNWISTEGSAATARVTEHLLEVSPVDEVKAIKQAGKAELQSSGDKPFWQKDHLVWNVTVRCPTGTCVRSFDVNTATNTVRSDDFAMPGTQLFNGASGFDSRGNMWLLMSAAKPDGFVGLALAGRTASGQIIQPEMIVEGRAYIDDPVRLYLFGLIETKPPREHQTIRFGDYVEAAQDPIDGSVWFMGMYAAGKGPLNRESAAGCMAVNVKGN